jgi:hypothetical protein
MITRALADFKIDLGDAQASYRGAAAFWDVGLVTFDGVDGTEDLLRLAAGIGSVYPHRDATPDGITYIDSKKREPTDVAKIITNPLPVHTDSSGEDLPPVGLLVLCTKEAHSGGESLFADGRAIVRQLQTAHPQTFAKLNCADAATFRSVGYAAGVESRPGPPRSRPIIEALAGGRYAIRFRPDPVAWAQDMGESLAVFADVVRQHVFALPVKRGQGYLVQNDRFLHGRNGAIGERETLRLLLRMEHWPAPWTPPRGFALG